MNNHILLVMKYLNDNSSVTTEELEENKKTAEIAYFAAATATADTAADAAATTTARTADYWVDEYFKHSVEDKQTYIDELKKEI